MRFTHLYNRRCRQRVTFADRILERTEKMRDAVRVVADQFPLLRQHGIAIACRNEHAPHPQHPPRTVKCFLDGAILPYNAADALICATRNGGLAMMDGGDLGTLEVGKLADLILVNGDVLADVSILTDHGRIALVMKDGAIQRAAPALKLSNPFPALEAAE